METIMAPDFTRLLAEVLTLTGIDEAHVEVIEGLLNEAHYDDGYSDGYADGYDVGYEDGHSESHSAV